MQVALFPDYHLIHAFAVNQQLTKIHASKNVRSIVSSKFMKIESIHELFAILPENERIMVDVLREIVLESLPSYCNVRISFSVPYFYGYTGICIIWTATVPRGGIKSEVLFGFWYGNRLSDRDNFLTHGTNKQIFYKIYQTPKDFDDKPINRLLRKAIKLDLSFC